MDIGTGIFLGMVLLGVIALYIATRDRWKWRKFVIRGGAVCCALLLTIWGGLAATAAYENRTVPVHAYQGLQVTDTKADVRFKKGEPTEISKAIWGYATDSQAWETVVLFSGEQIRAIFYGGNCTYCNTLNGISIGTSYDTVIEKLGQPNTVSTSKDGLSRYLSFKDTNMVVRMARGRVDAVGVYNPRVGPPEFAG
jgi:MFS family permease